MDMRDRRLHAALTTFAEEAAWQLASEMAEGAEVAFEVVDAAGGGFGHTPLYCYRPRTADFIRDRERRLADLPSFLPALHAVVATGGAERYLHARAEPRIPAGERPRAQVALRVFLERVFEDATEFVLAPERLERACTELEELVVDGRPVTEVIVPVLGLELGSEAVELGDGLSLVRGDTLDDAPAEAVWDGDRANVLAVVRGTDDAVADQAPARMRRLVTALRLYGASAVALGPGAWLRTAGGPWHLVLVAGGSRPRGVCVLSREQEDELRAFCNLIWRRTPRGGEIAWALARYELGCERANPLERLTDHLLALRALLEHEGPQSARLPGRLAALCATDDARATLAERVAHAVDLERVSVTGHVTPHGPALKLIDELSGHLRALLRDVLCGHLDSDLRTLADDLLLEYDEHEQPTPA